MIAKLNEVVEGKGWETRRKILQELNQHPSTAYELSKSLGLNYSTVKYHLDLLQKVGLVSYMKSGNKYLYKTSRNVEVMKLI
ncbi:MULTISPECIES: winged helix-turn-helix domain-containing protein [Acidianus]|uniref:ArsR family transcriptional regulator n=1 Tax=Candidatus Acidianus copahuensis TaxID=1160895 RepID=A0A031LP77_9CREN|nr:MULTISPECIES: winged helix-turn-helix domain-containing protein [Acidianus]EZQ06570.1 ArsR family transcriptional regulator [Candidatus Acidianus copahuensis]NON63233.1 winged helix-turn-helix transcriptional regulator [Acidianus sp. RZ1]